METALNSFTTSACRADAMSKPARWARSKPGRRSPDAKPGRYIEKSAPAMASATPPCIPTPSAKSSRFAMAGIGVDGFDRLSAQSYARMPFPEPRRVTTIQPQQSSVGDMLVSGRESTKLYSTRLRTWLSTIINGGYHEIDVQDGRDGHWT